MINASIIGASGYTGGEVLRLLLGHPEVEVKHVTSESNTGKFVHTVHPNLRKRTQLKFTNADTAREAGADVFFMCLPHGTSMKNMQEFVDSGAKIIDLSADFRLKNAEEYVTWYGHEHTNPELLEKFVYGIPELHREEMKTAKYVSSAGCLATATILALYPLFKNNLIENRFISEGKVGSSAAGNKPSLGSHHAERSGCFRSFMPTSHRHSAEMIQELSFSSNSDNAVDASFSATAVEAVRGILSTSHVFLTEENKDMTDMDIWKIYRQEYGEELFIRIVKEKTGIYRYPEMKILAGTNYCDIGFERDNTKGSRRIVVMSAIDNLMKGAAGQAVQALNIMHGFDERLGLEFSGLHPI